MVISIAQRSHLLFSPACPGLKLNGAAFSKYGNNVQMTSNQKIELCWYLAWASIVRSMLLMLPSSIRKGNPSTNIGGISHFQPWCSTT